MNRFPTKKQFKHGIEHSGKKSKSGSVYPLQIQAEVQIDKVFRFASTGALAGQPVAQTDLRDLLIVALTATTGKCLATTYRLRRVEIWGSPNSAGAPSTVSFEDLSGAGSFASSNRRWSDTTIGTARGPHVVIKASHETPLGNWNDASSATNAFQIVATEKCVIDVHISFVCQNGTAITPVKAVAAATAGLLYLRALDNSQATPSILALNQVSI
jgi:hypothetical protein